ncbi:MAG: hypothetical protein ACON4Z_06590 [Planctomycetota bacterium]
MPSYHSASSPRARASLRRLTAPHAITFSARLLQRSEQGVLTFRAFVQTARELVRDDPDRCATYLAALVALEMGAPDDDGGPAHASARGEPSAN